MELNQAIGQAEALASVDPRNVSAFGAFVAAMPDEKKMRLRKALTKALATPLDPETMAPMIEKATTSGLTTTTNLVPYSLEAPAMELWSVVTPLVNKLPRKHYGGTGHHWKRITAVDAVESYGFVAEPTDTTANTVSGRAGFNQITEADDSVAFKTLGLDSYITFKGRYGGNTTVNSGMDFRPDELVRLGALQALRMREEKAVLGSQTTAFGSPGAVTKTNVTQEATAKGSLTAATAYKFTVSALSPLGKRLGSTGHAAADSTGESPAAASTSLTTAGGGSAGDTSLTFTWAPVAGAVAYNVFGDTAVGDTRKYLFTVCSCKAVVRTITPASTNVPNTADTSADANGFKGLIQLLAANAGYVKSLNGAELSGTKSYVNEFDAMFQSQFVTNQLGATQIYMNAVDLRKALDIVVGSNAPYLRIDVQAGAQNVVGGLGVKGVINNYTGKVVDFIVHPYLPQGTMLAWCDDLGMYYPNANIPNPVEIGTGFDYLNIDWAPTSLRQEFGIYVDEAPILRAGFPLGILTDIGSNQILP